jgi:predicted nucleic acid-binding OB-fold protein
MYGNKHSLKYLRGLGYKTFGDFIDESYDELDSWDRLDAIIKIIQDIKEMPANKKLEWFMSMQPILDHNFKTLE